VRFYVKEGESARHSGHCYTSPAAHIPDSNIARQLLSAPVLLRGKWACGWRA